MPGFQFAYSTAPVSAPRIETAFWPNSQTLRDGDIVVFTTNATYTTSSIPVVRNLLAIDKAADYKQGTPIAGILGVVREPGISNSTGVVTSYPTLPTVNAGAAPNYSFVGMSTGRPVDPATGRSRFEYYPFSSDSIFVAKLDATSANATPLLENTPCGLILTVSGNLITYTIDTNASAADQCLRILRCDESDPLYNNGKGRVYVQAFGTFSQLTTAVNYTT